VNTALKEGGKLTPQCQNEIENTVKEGVIIIFGALPQSFVLTAEGGFVEPGVQSVDVLEVEVNEVVCCSSRRKDEGVDVVYGDAGGLRAAGTGLGSGSCGSCDLGRGYVGGAADGCFYPLHKR